jgi:hypothetical protein
MKEVHPQLPVLIGRAARRGHENRNARHLPICQQGPQVVSRELIHGLAFL